MEVRPPGVESVKSEAGFGVVPRGIQTASQKQQCKRTAKQ